MNDTCVLSALNVGIPSIASGIVVTRSEPSSMVSENVMEMRALTRTLVALLAGTVDTIVGAVVSGAASVVNENVEVPDSALPATSLPTTVTL